MSSPIAAVSSLRPPTPPPAAARGRVGVDVGADVPTGDRVEISAEGRRLAAVGGAAGGNEDSAPAEAEAPGAGTPERLDEDERRELEELRSRDREVRAHEQAHKAALGGEGGSPSYSYETGPDGRRYAVEGEVAVSVSGVAGDPSATIERARRIARAAVAPAKPSGADMRVRAEALRLEQKARDELRAEREETGESAAGLERAPEPAGVEVAADAEATYCRECGRSHGPGEHP